MLKGDGFGPHSEKHGHRLGKQIAAGPTGLARRIVAAGPGGLAERVGEIEQQGRVVGTVFGPDAEREFVRRAQDEAAAAGANDNRPRGKRGPAPAAGPRPWEVEGMSRASWFRRRKGGGGG
jgi:hypothetical protein